MPILGLSNDSDSRASGSRTLAFGHVLLLVGWDSRGARDVVEFLFSDVPGGLEGSPPTASLSIVAPDASGKIVLSCDQVERWRGRSFAGLTSAILDAVQREIAMRSRTGALFHAAAVAVGGKALLMPGESGAGKTSLCAWLLGRGFGYLTDELVFAERARARLQYFSRPLHVKRSGFSAVLALLPPGELGSVLSTPSGRLVPHRLLQPNAPPPSQDVGLILLPRFDPRAECELRVLSRADTGRRLMACLINGRNLPDHGLQEATRFARTADAYSLTFSSFDQLESLVDPLLDRYFGPLPASPRGSKPNARAMSNDV